MQPRPVDERRELGRGRDARRLGKAGDRVAPRAMEEAVDEQERDRVEEQGRHHLVDPEPHAQQRPAATPTSRRPAPRRAIMSGSARIGGRSPTTIPMPAAPIAPSNSWPSAPMFQYPARKAIATAAPVKQDRGGADEHLEQGEPGGQRHDDERGVGLDRVGAGEKDRHGRDDERDEHGRDHEHRRRTRWRCASRGPSAAGHQQCRAAPRPRRRPPSRQRCGPRRGRRAGRPGPAARRDPRTPAGWPRPRRDEQGAATGRTRWPRRPGRAWAGRRPVRRGSRERTRARSTFWMLPPDSVATGSSGRARMSNRWISSAACSRTRRSSIRPPRRKSSSRSITRL